jgi:hypothetical protein
MEKNNSDNDGQMQSSNNEEEKLNIISKNDNLNHQGDKEEIESKEKKDNMIESKKSSKKSIPKENKNKVFCKRVNPPKNRKMKNKLNPFLTENNTLENNKRNSKHEIMRKSGKISYLNNYKKDNTSEIKETGLNKTVFSKISENMYYNSKEDKLPVKKVRNLELENVENYNKLTEEAYLCSCANKANKENKKIICEFLGRKKNEEISKKIGLDSEKDKENEMETLKDVKRLTILTDRNRSYTSSRTFNEFLQDQKNKEEKHQNHLKTNVNQSREQLKTILRDRPELNEESIKLAKNSNRNTRINIHSRLYQEYNEKKKREKEKEMEKKIVNEKNENNKLSKSKIQQNFERLFHEYEVKKKKYNEIENKRNKELRNLSFNHSNISKNSNEIIFKRFKKNLEYFLEDKIGKKINENFEINYMDFVNLLYEINFTTKNYYELIQSKGKNRDMIEKSIKLNEINKGNNNRVIYRKTNNEFDKEYKLIIDAWKIIIKNKEFNEEIPGTSKRLLLFFLSVLGIYNGNNDDPFIKKEFPFVVNYIKENNGANYTNLSKQIYKYFSLYRNNAINGLLFRERESRRRLEIENEIEKKLPFTPTLEKSSKDFFASNNSVKEMRLSVEKNYEQLRKNKEFKLKEKEKLLQKEEKQKCPFVPLCSKIKGKVNILEISQRLHKTGLKHLKSNSSSPYNDNIGNDNNHNKTHMTESHKNITKNNCMQKMFNNNPLEKDLRVKQKIKELKESRNQESFKKLILKKGFKPKENHNNNNDLYEFNELNYKNERFAHDDEPLNNFKNTFKKYEKFVTKPKNEKYVFEIIIDNKPRKLVIYQNDDINYKVKDFCNVYKLNYNDKKRIFLTINQNLKERNNFY